VPGVRVASVPAAMMRRIQWLPGGLSNLPGIIIITPSGLALSTTFLRFACSPRGYGVFGGCPPCPFPLRGCRLASRVWARWGRLWCGGSHPFPFPYPWGGAPARTSPRPGVSPCLRRSVPACVCACLRVCVHAWVPACVRARCSCCWKSSIR
jgi:hypothetical protein